MTRRRYVQIAGELVEVTPDYTPEPRNANHNGILWNDRAYQDVGDKRFKSRTQHREYMKANNLTIADDFKETWRKDEKKRVDIKSGVDPTRRADIERSIYQLNEQRRNIRR